MMDAALTLLSDHGVKAYFLILGIAIYHCIKVYYTPINIKQHTSSSKSQTIKDDTPLSTNKPSIIPLILSTLIILTTWYLIIKFILLNIYTSSYFDDAYKDVLQSTSNSSSNYPMNHNGNGHYFTSTQLLTWAIVAVVWCAVEECNVCFIIFGFLGAMSASFVLWVPTLYRGRSSNVVGSVIRRRSKEKNQSSSLPITYIITSIIAFVSILNLQPCNPTLSSEQQCTPDEGFGTFHINFRYWLQLLHVILIVPIFIPYVLPKIVYDKLPSISSCFLFGLLFVTFSYWHLYQLIFTTSSMSNGDGQQCSDNDSNISRGARYTMPITDCQLSITTDLICCSFITLYAIYKDYSTTAGRRDFGRDDSSRGVAFTRMCMGAILMPLVSPAAVLAGHLCFMRLNDYHTGLVASLQRLVASKLSGGNDIKWCNLGLWTTTSTFDNDNESDTCEYNEACENLAKALGKAAELDSNDAVLSCGCGSTLHEVQYYKRQFNLRHITGIDPHLDEGRMTDMNDYNVRAIRAGVEELAAVDDDEDDMALFPPRLFNKILALDNIYHYSCKESFLKDCFTMLPSGGKVAASDVVLKNDSDVTPLWVTIVLRLMGIPTCNLWSVDQYKIKLASIGYGDTKVQLVGEQVFKGWQRFLPRCLLKHLDYALIVATKLPGLNTNLQPTKRKSVAIIGSGLAGLSSAYSLLSSSEAANLDIDIYEANDCPGLAGNTTLVGGQLVDVPARMACLGYYDHYCELLEELDIPSTVVRTDSSFYGDDGHGNQVCYSYGQSSLANIYSAIVCGGIGMLWRMIKALGNLQCDGDNNENITFGDWLHINLGVSKETSYTCNRTGLEKQHDLPSLTCYGNPFAYIMCGSLSWMLSCTWDDLLNYPADIVLPYCSGLKMDKLGVGRKGQVIRITPSIKCLERTLLYGVRQLHVNKRVSAIDNKRMINGISYDAVIVATEAKAVPKVIKHCSPVFEKITYHPSCIYIHTDESFMPPNKKDWKCWNVEMSSGRQEPQLTFWLNGFYPDASFDKNVFQTWAPINTPKEDTIIRHSQFERVVHSNDARSYITDINKEQGNNGIYYAGSYCVYGMGLLEQALISGKEVSKLVLNDMISSSAIKEAIATPPPLKALVIGAGPSGLVTAKYLLQSTNPTYDVTIVESSSSIVGSFQNKVYDNCRLVSSKYLTAFSDIRMSKDTIDHPSAQDYVAYLQSYAEKFGLLKLIKFGCSVVSVKDANDKSSGKEETDLAGYEVQYTNYSSSNDIIIEEYDMVAVCSGLHNIPFIPELFRPSDTKDDMSSKFKGTIIHSSEYKEASIFTNKRVLILGCGDTALDIAHRAVMNPETESVALSVRRGFLSIPHNLAVDRPLDVFITNLFEHAYEHPWIHALRLRWWLSTIFIRLFLFLTGSSWGFNQWAAPTKPVKRGYHIINKSHAAMSHMNVPIKSQSLYGRLWMWVYGETDLKPIQTFHQTQVAGVEEDGITVMFSDGRTYEADLIVLATGYKQSFPFLDDKIRHDIQEESSTDDSSYYLEEDYLPSEHFIVSKAHPRLGFIGFVRPNVGAVPPMSELQVMWWLEHMKGRTKKLTKKTGPPSYMVLGQKYRYGVDYGNYMHRVAEEINAAPTLTTLAKSRHPIKALYTYCIGQSMISLFRLQGPYKSELCWEVVTGELWRVCLKRGLVENCGLLYMTFLSLLMNITACVMECVWCIITLRKPKFFVRY